MSFRLADMSNRAARFTQADIARAIRAIEQTGAHMAVELLPDGTIRIAAEVQRPVNVMDYFTPRGAAADPADRGEVIPL